MKAAVLTEYNQVVWKDVEKPVCKAGEVLLKMFISSFLWGIGMMRNT